MNTKLDKIIKLILIYTTVVIILFLGIYFFANILDNNITTVSIEMKQSQTQNVWVKYEYQTYNDRDYSVSQTINASEQFETYIFNIPEKYISNLDLEFTMNGNEPNSIEIKEITISKRFSKTKLKQFENYSVQVNNPAERITIVDGIVFSDFELNTKIKIISLILAIIITILTRKYINKIFIDTELSKQRFKVTVFTFSLAAVYGAMFISIDEEISNLLNGSLAQKPIIKSYGEILDKSFMNNFEKYKKNQYLYRDFLIEDYYAFNRLLQRNYYNGIYMTGSDNENANTVIYDTTYNKENLDSSIENVTILNEYLTHNNVPYYYFLAPDSSVFNLELYPDYLKSESIEIYDYTFNELEKNGVNAYNLYDYMNNNLVDKSESLYYRLDNHWTVETALDVYGHMVNTMIEDGVGINGDVEFNLDTYEDMFCGWYGSRLAYGYRYNQVKDTYTVAYPKSEYNYTVKSAYNDNSFEGNYYTVANLHNITKQQKYLHLYNYSVGNATNNIIINNDIDNDKTAVIIGDSFSKPVVLFLTQNFKRVIALDNRSVASGQTYEFIRDNLENIDVVIGLNTISSNNENPSCFNYFGDNIIKTGNYKLGDEITNRNAEFENFYGYKDWSNGDGGIVLDIGDVDDSKTYSLILNTNIYSSVQKIEVYINEVLIDTLEDFDVMVGEDFEININSGVLHNGENKIYFKVYGADSPKNTGDSADDRILGLLINEIKLVEKN